MSSTVDDQQCETADNEPLERSISVSLINVSSALILNCIQSDWPIRLSMVADHNHDEPQFGSRVAPNWSSHLANWKFELEA